MITRHQRSLPFVFIALSVALGCTMDGFIKYLSGTTGLVTILSLRYFFGAIIAVTVYLFPKRLADGRRVKRGWPTRASFGFQVVRSVLLVMAAYLFFYGLIRLNLATATILGFTAALMVPLLAWPTLGERPSFITLGLSLLGFAGAALAVSGQGFNVPVAGEASDVLIGAAACMVSAVLYAAVLILLRLRAGKDGPVTTALFSNTVPALIMFPLFLALGGMDATTLPVLGITAITGAIGYSIWYTMAMAYAAAPAEQLTPFEYSGLIWASVIGFLFFGEQPSWHIWVGGSIIISSCLAIAAQTHYITRKATKMPTSQMPE